MNLFEQIINDKNVFLKKKSKALKRFAEKGFPTTKNEEYRFTDLSEALEKTYNFYPEKEHNILAETLENLHLGEENFDWLVFVNGIFREELSKITDKSIISGNIYEIDNQEISKYFNKISEKNSFTDLNFALNKNGLFISVPKNTKIEKPVHVFYISENQKDNTFYNPRNLLIVEENSEIEIIESHHNFDENFTLTNSVTEIYVGKNAKADWLKLENDSEKSYLIDHTFAKQETDSRATVNTFAFGGKLVRNNLIFNHNGENINSFMNGITIIGGEQLIDHHTSVHHNLPNCESYQNYKCVLKDGAHGVFNGKIFVDKIAQKTNAYQKNDNILLSEGAVIDTKPQLEIFADDVKCSHGCTVGRLNEEALFYLRSRGILQKEAQALLLYAFANDAMRNIDIEPLRRKVSKLLAEKLDVNMEF